MASRIRHLAICSAKGPALSRFYQTLFGMSTSGRPRPGRAESAAPVVTDGYVGMNFNPHSNGRQGGLHHFGIEVDDVELIRARVSELYPSVHLLERPSSRPFAGISMHDPAGNIFDLSHKKMDNIEDVYADMGGAHHPRHIDHFMLRAMDAPSLARFYQEVFDFEEVDKAPGDPRTYLSDGTLTLILAPWRIEDYTGTSIERPCLDHIGFHVESVEQLAADLDRMAENDPELTPQPFRGPEGEVKLELLKGCAYGHLHLSDPSGVQLDVNE